MATLSASLQTMNAMSTQLTRISNQVDRVTTAAQKMNHEMGAGRNLLVQLNNQQQIISNTQKIIQVTHVVNNHYQQINNTMNQTNQIINQNTAQQRKFNDEVKKGNRDWGAMFAKVKQAGGALGGLFSKGAAIADDFINNGARLDFINDGSQSTPELRDKVFAAAKRSRGSFSTMANTVSKLGMAAPDAFGSNNEMVAFGELMQKSFKIGGASEQDQQSGMDQLTQAMASGGLSGGALQSLTANAPILTQAIADFTGKSVSELLAMGEQGSITADVIKGAMFSAADDINGKFREVPGTFGEVFTSLKDTVLQAFSPMIDAVSNNMDIVKNVLLALGGVAIWFGAVWFAAWIQATWPILAVIGVIAGILYLLEKLGVSTSDVVGFIMGTFYSLFAFIWNQVALVWNFILSFAEFLVNIFIDPVYAVQKLFYDLIKNIIDYFGSFINGITSKIDWLIGKFNDLTGTEIGKIGKLDSDWVEQIKPSKSSNVVDFSKNKMKMKDLGDAFNQGFAADTGLLSNLLGGSNGFLPGGDAPEMSPTGPNINKVNEVGKINSTVDISSEDLKTMRELAEMKNIQNFVTLTPQFSFGDTHVKQDGRSIDEIMANISERMNEAITSSAQGVYG